MATKKNDEAPEQATVTVRVIGQPLAEAGATHNVGDTFETTPERAAALGNSVEAV